MNTQWRGRTKLLVSVLGIVTLSMPTLDIASGAVNRFYPGRSSNPGIWGWQRPSLGYYYNRANETQTFRSYSYTPARFHEGDNVVVTADQASLKSGHRTIGVAKKGQKLVVQRVEGPWLRTKIEVDGKTISGWVWNQHVAFDKGLDAAAPASAEAVAPARSEDRSDAYTRPYRTNRRYRR
ncbi:MAG: hypothetical protein KDB05_31590 [Planctomycetales bacterium]|nr:hypothetical protein [Planctomycetales bacterium]